MKRYFILCALILNSIPVYADWTLHRDPIKRCDTDEVKSLLGEHGSCQSIVSLKHVPIRGVCHGNFQMIFPCTIAYEVTSDESSVKLSCGPSGAKSDFDLDMASEAYTYNVLTKVKTSTGETILLDDEQDYTLIWNNQIKVKLGKKDSAYLASGDNSITLNFDKEDVSLDNVHCD